MRFLIHSFWLLAAYIPLLFALTVPAAHLEQRDMFLAERQDAALTESSDNTDTGTIPTLTSFDTDSIPLASSLTSTLDVPTLPSNPRLVSSSSSSATTPSVSSSSNSASFLSNSSAMLVLFSTLSGVVGVILVLVIWINCRRHRRSLSSEEDEKDDSKWTMVSLPEKSQESPSYKNDNKSTETFAKAPGSSSDDHTFYPASHASKILPPVPTIRVDSPYSSRDLPIHSEISRWSAATSRFSSSRSESVYSQRVASYVGGEYAIDAYMRGENVPSNLEHETASQGTVRGPRSISRNSPLSQLISLQPPPIGEVYYANFGSKETNPPPSPGSRSPHYLTTTTRLALNGRTSPSRI